ncbi:hypothetical protein C8R45DRAFT_946897 [Mycena sanguinolenta]|nr:hypothetical protein C8R45DRAFT_946897 [Mycena sanguinolenta]
MSAMADLVREYTKQQDEELSLFSRATSIADKRNLKTTNIMDRGILKDGPRDSRFALERGFRMRTEHMRIEMQSLLSRTATLVPGRGRHFIIDPHQVLTTVLCGSSDIRELNATWMALSERMSMSGKKYWENTQPLRWVFVQCNKFPKRPVSGGVADVNYANSQIGWGQCSFFFTTTAARPLIVTRSLSPPLFPTSVSGLMFWYNTLQTHCEAKESGNTVGEPPFTPTTVTIPAALGPIATNWLPLLQSPLYPLPQRSRLSSRQRPTEISPTTSTPLTTVPKVPVSISPYTLHAIAVFDSASHARAHTPLHRRPCCVRTPPRHHPTHCLPPHYAHPPAPRTPNASVYLYAGITHAVGGGVAHRWRWGYTRHATASYPCTIEPAAMSCRRRRRAVPMPA